MDWAGWALFGLVATTAVDGGRSDSGLRLCGAWVRRWVYHPLP